MRLVTIGLLAALIASACSAAAPSTTITSTPAAVTLTPATPAPFTPAPTGTPPTITLTNSDCTSEGLSGVLQSEFAAVLVNTTSSRAAFNLHRLINGRTYSELEQFVQARQQAIAAGDSAPVVPPMTSHTALVFVGAGQRGKLEGTLSSGTYGVVCRRDSPTPATVEAIYVKGPFQVN